MQVERWDRQSKLTSNLRGLSFGTMVVLTLFAIFGSYGPAVPVLALVAGLCFVALVIVHGKIIEKHAAALRLASVNEMALLRTRGDTVAFAQDGRQYLTSDHAYASDLDLFGRGSLFQRINVAHTKYGQDTLARYLLAPASLAEIAERQEAARLLAPDLEFRQRLESSAIQLTETRAHRAKPEATPDPTRFLQWAESASQLASPGRWRAAAWGLPLLTGCAWLAGRLLAEVPYALWVAPLTVQLWVVWVTRAAVSGAFAAVTQGDTVLHRVGPMLELLEQTPASASLLAGIKSRVVVSSTASREVARPSLLMRRFASLVSWFELRHNALVHPFANALLLWDLHCILALDRWKAQHGRDVRAWFEALGELEAVSSFATLAYDNPDYAWPVVTPASSQFQAAELGHPLLARHERVHNDISLPAPGTALLITGSNMSGKSTLMRSMGLAAVMALGGAPVCARALSLGLLQCHTSIRVGDSLERGVSHFYAELQRIKQVLDAARSGKAVFFLLDEILQGTNSLERGIGARWIFEQLLELKALGAISTHDLALCQAGDSWMQRVQLVHLRETAEHGKMTFDYKLRPGPVQGGNALRLMQALGLDVPGA